MKASRILSGLVLLAAGLLAGSAQGQVQVRPLVNGGRELHGVLAAGWLGNDELLVGGLDNAVRRYLVALTPSPNVRLVETYADGVRHMTLSERSRSILALAVSGDRKQFVAGGTDFQATIWRVDTVIPGVAAKPGASAPVFASDLVNRRFAAIANGKVQVWETIPPGELKPLPLSAAFSSPTALAFDGETGALAVSGPGGAVRIRDLEHQKETETIESPESTATVPVFESRARRLWTAGNDGVVRAWRLGLTAPTFKTVALDSASFASSQDRTRLATVHPTRGLQLWEMSPRGMRELAVTTAPGARAGCLIATSGDGSVTAYVRASADGEVIRIVNKQLQTVADVETPVPFRTLSALCVSPLGGFVAAGDQCGRVFTRKAGPQDEPWLLVGSSPDVQALKFLDEGELLLSVGGKKLLLWTVSIPELASHADLDRAFSAMESWAAEDAFEVVVGMGDGSDGPQLAQYTLTRGTEGRWAFQQRRSWEAPTGEVLRSLTASTDGRHLVVTTDFNKHHLWALPPEGQPILMFSGCTEGTSLKSAWLLDDGQTLFPLSDDRDSAGQLYRGHRGWRVPTAAGETLRVLRAVPSSVPVPIGHLLVTSSADQHQTVRVYSMSEDGQLATVSTLRGHLAEVSAASLVSDLSSSAGPASAPVCAVTGALDSTVRCWELATGKQLSSQAVSQPVKSLAGAIASSHCDSGVVVAGLGRGVVATIDFSEPARPHLLLQQQIETAANGDLAAVSLLPDGSTLAMGTAPGSVLFRRSRPEVQFGKPAIRQLAGLTDLRRAIDQYHSSPVYATAWSPDGKWVATATADGAARYWRSTTGEFKGLLYHPGANEPLASPGAIISPDRDKPWIAPRGLWSGDQPPANGNPLYAIHFKDDTSLRTLMAQPVAWPKGTLGQLVVWPLSTGDPAPQPVNGLRPSETITCVAHAAGHDVLAVGTSQRRVIVQGQLVIGSPIEKELNFPAEGSPPAGPVPDQIEGIALWTDGSALRVAAISRDGQIAVWVRSGPSWQYAGDSQIPQAPDALACTAVTWNKDGNRLVVTAVPRSTEADPQADVAESKLWFFDVR